MLAFVDESGDPGMALERGSSRFFTIAVAVFETSDAALSCQRAIEALRARLGMRPTSEFHFHNDSHERRLALLDVLRRCNFRYSAFSLNKASPRLVAPGYQYKESLYKNVCKMAMENAAPILDNAKVVIDGSGDRMFRRQLERYLKQNLVIDGRRCVSSIAIKRSQSDPLLQVADYCAGVSNRVRLEKEGAGEYAAKLRRRSYSVRVWPR